MGNYKFRLSDMMPNAWFYKLKDMSRSKKKHPTTSSTTTTTTKSSQNSKKSNHSSHLRKSYYFTRDLTTPNDRFYNSPSKDPPRKSLKSRGRGRKAKSFAMRSSYPSPKLVSSTVSSSCSCRTKFNDPELTCSTLDNNSPVHEHELASPENDFRSDSVLPIESSFDEMVSLSSSCAPGGVSSSDKDIIINVDKNSLSRKFDNKAEEFDSLSGHELPPIITKPGKFDDDVVKDVKKKKKKKKKQNKSTERSLSVKEDNIAIKDNKKDKNSPLRRRLSVSSGSPAGVRLRINSPKIANRVLQGYSRRSISSPSTGTRRSLSDSFAILKASHDPQTDFRESMVEMIVENNIRASKDLEDLLACYLSLNSDEYHDLIIKVFKQIWFDLY